jgi:membrane-associated phospholipid phosphatase
MRAVSSVQLRDPAPRRRYRWQLSPGSEVRTSSLRERLHGRDHNLYASVAAMEHGLLESVIPRLSNAANHSRLWFGMGGVIAAAGGPRGRQSAARALGAIGVSSFLTNVVGKRVWHRDRPNQNELVPVQRHVHMPLSSSFPSGHTASAFAFATVVTTAHRELAVPVGGLASLVAYSRVYTGVHYPADVLIGSVIGTAVGAAVLAGFPVHGERPRRRRGRGS